MTNEEATDRATEKAMTIEVTLNVYSGRPNPTWSLTERQVEELRRLLAASRGERREAAAEPPSLGYRGFTVTNHRRVRELPYRVEVYGGTLTTSERRSSGEKVHAKPAYYGDVHQVEAWLLEQAQERGYAATIAGGGGPRLDRSDAP